MIEMGILVDKKSKVLVQGITGRLGRRQTGLMLEYGTNIVAGVTPGKGGKTVHGVPVYDTVKEALKKHEIDVSIVYVPAPFVRDAVFEAMDSRVEFVVVITDWVPYQDEMKMKTFAKKKGVRYLGPNTPGIAVPDEIALGMLSSPSVMTSGNVALVSRSGTLTGEITQQLTETGIGESVVMGLGGDPIVGIRMKEAVELLEEDEQTEVIVLIGEIGGTMEEEAGKFIKEQGTKPVIGFLSGRTAPRRKRMGHAGAIITRGKGTIESKIKAFKQAGVEVAEKLGDISAIVERKL